MNFSPDSIIINDQVIINKMLINRDSFDKTISEILTEYFNESGVRNNQVYIKVMDLNTSQRHKFHTYERIDVNIYSVGDQESRSMIIQFKTRYITNIFKKYQQVAPIPVVDISEEIASFKNLMIKDLNNIINIRTEELLMKLKI